MTALLRALFAAALLALPAVPRAQEAAGGEAHGAAAPAVETLPAITVSEVRLRPLTDRVIASGLVDGVEEVQVQPLIEGQPINELLADGGDVVERGQVLARLSTATLELQFGQLAANRASAQAQIAQAEASLLQATATAEEAERVAARDQELAQASTVPRTQADQSQAAAVSARAAVGVAEQGVAAAQAQLAFVDAQIASGELQLSRTEVKAPVGGLVVARNAQVGAIASAAGARCSPSCVTTPWSCAPTCPSRTFCGCGPGRGRRWLPLKGASPSTGPCASWSRPSTRRPGSAPRGSPSTTPRRW